LVHALSIPAAYVCLTAVEGMAVTPWVLGRRLRMSPVATFLSVVLWGWIWGIVGALVAVPLLVAFKILCDHIPELAPVAEFLSHERAAPPATPIREATT
jgi:predicted PurR-regulated permease PerM